MDKQLISILKLMHEEAKRAYWSIHNDCGYDFNDKFCEGCGNFPQCEQQLVIEHQLEELEAGM